MLECEFLCGCILPNALKRICEHRVSKPITASDCRRYGLESFSSFHISATAHQLCRVVDLWKLIRSHNAPRCHRGERYGSENITVDEWVGKDSVTVKTVQLRPSRSASPKAIWNAVPRTRPQQEGHTSTHDVR